MCSAGAYAQGCGGAAPGQCVLCSPGTYLRAPATTCSLCEAGTYTSYAGAPACSLCALGYFAPGNGSTLCRVCNTSLCSVGLFRNICSSMTDSVCVACEPPAPANSIYNWPALNLTTFESLDYVDRISFGASRCNWTTCITGFTKSSSNIDCVPCKINLPANASFVTLSPETSISELVRNTAGAFLIVERDLSRTSLKAKEGQKVIVKSSQLHSNTGQRSLTSGFSGRFSNYFPSLLAEGDPLACSWACNSGFVLSQNGDCREMINVTKQATVAASLCGTNRYWSNVSKSCTSCSAPSCFPWQFLQACSSSRDALCIDCGQCAVGKFLTYCQSINAPNCQLCTNKYELTPCVPSNFSVSFYISSGMLQSNCSWSCNLSYFRTGDKCVKCSDSSCSIGNYRSACVPDADGICVSCSNLPDNAIFTTAGIPYDEDNCSWACLDGFYRHIVSNSFVCVACQQPSSCPLGQYVLPCTSTENFLCTECPFVHAALYYIQGSCDFECASGYYRHEDACAACNINLTCLKGQILLGCTSAHDSSCVFCKAGVEYDAAEPSASTADCRNCSVTECNSTGTFLAICSPTADSQCVPCTNKPLNSYYTSAGANYVNNCSWRCMPGFYILFIDALNMNLCFPCAPGTYSHAAESACELCSAGTYSANVGASSQTVCSACPQGKFSTQPQATSISTCRDCVSGTYQENVGSSFCNLCPKDTYGNMTGAISLDQCFACRSLDTSTRGAVGQKYETSCICNQDYYRVRNSTTECQKCPPGLVCNGLSSVEPVVNSSLWNVVTLGISDYYRLVFCPAGYFYPDLNYLLSATDPNINALVASQQCTMCDAGMECVSPPCATCTKCKPGHFKSCPGPFSCLLCPENSYEPSNGSLQCKSCDAGTTTHGQRGCTKSNFCVCDSSHYDLNLNEGCQICPAGLTCFGNSTYISVPLLSGSSEWEITTDSTGKSKLNLSFCPRGYFIAGSLLDPAQLQCIACSIGFECTDPPCYGSCNMCLPGFYKAAEISYPSQVPGSHYDALVGAYVREWIEEPCASCPVNTYRYLHGGTEIGSCTVCPPKSTTGGLLNRSDPADCRCEMFYYEQAVPQSSGLTCTDCPEGAVCTSNLECALNSLGIDTFKVGDVQSNLSCSNPLDVIYGSWKRDVLGNYRLISCPAGFTLQRSEVSVTADKCVECPLDSYLLDEVTSPSVQCKPCPIGAVCPGGSSVTASPGYWRAPTTRRGTLLTAVLYQCPLGVCNADNTCNNNRTGLV